jgi:hypothetical protein
MSRLASALHVDDLEPTRREPQAWQRQAIRLEDLLVQPVGTAKTRGAVLSTAEFSSFSFSFYPVTTSGSCGRRARNRTSRFRDARR